MTSDKRGNTRYNVFLSPPACSKSDDENVKVDIHDISCAGIKICTDERLIKGDNIDLEVIIPEDDIPMFVGGEIVWVVKDPGFEDTYNAGVRLTRVNDCDKGRIVKYINETFISLG
ncbi:PilZ domain-containing protein [Candidatus Omnitrophota bacterium]